MGEAVPWNVVNGTVAIEVALQFVPFEREHVSAVQAFNKRMLDGHAETDFLLPDEFCPGQTPADAPIRWQHFLATEGDEVRGGVLEMDQPGWLNGRPVRALNFQSPLSEGLIDRSKAMIAVQMVKFMQRRSDAVYALGMGASETPWRRLLKGAGWSLRPIPFLFRVHRAAKFFRGLPLLHRSRTRSMAAHLAGVTGFGYLALRIKQRSSVAVTASIRHEDSWGDWADEIWLRFRNECSFAVQRDRRTLESLYPPDDRRLHILLIEQNGNPIAWSVCLNTQMKEDKFFGSLRVASVLDCAAAREAMPVTAAAVDREMATRGADLVLLNHSHGAWIRAFRMAGFLEGPSNYMLGMSKSLTAAVRSQEGGEDRVHITRGDGDGRNHLA